MNFKDMAWLKLAGFPALAYWVVMTEDAANAGWFLKWIKVTKMTLWLRKNQEQLSREIDEYEKTRKAH